MSKYEVHHSVDKNASLAAPDPHQDMYQRNTLGFWVYLMTDCLLFASLFVTYAVLHHETFGGPTSKDLFELKLPFVETMALLSSSVCCGFAILASLKRHVRNTILLLLGALCFGFVFLALELHEFKTFLDAGHSFRNSAFLSSYFTLVGTHGIHVTVGSLWGLIVAAQLFFRGLTTFTFRRLVIFGMFWHFLDLVWIFIFTFVYLMGVL